MEEQQPLMAAWLAEEADCGPTAQRRTPTCYDDRWRGGRRVVVEVDDLIQTGLFLTGEMEGAGAMPEPIDGYQAAGVLPSTWKTAGRGWGHPLHKLSPYVGRFPAALVRYFVLNLSDPGQTVFDPWSGGGTTVLESALCDREAVGSDAFAYARILSRAKGDPLSYEAFDSYLRRKLDEATHVDNTHWRLLDNEDVRVSFSDYTLDQILRLREVLRGDEGREATFLKAVVSGVLHGPSAMFLSAPQKDQVSSTTDYVRKYLRERGIVPPDRDLYASCMRKAQLSLRDPLPHRCARVFRADCRDVPLGDDSVDLVVTTPPNMSVLSYPWNNWLRLWWLGADRLTESAALMQSGREDMYRAFMRASLAELWRVMRPNSAAVIVVGDVGQKKGGVVTVVNSAQLIADEAVALGFETDRIIDDVYGLNARSMLVQNMLKWQYTEEDHADKSSVLTDRCLVLRKGAIGWRCPRIDWASIKKRRMYLVS